MSQNYNTFLKLVLLARKKMFFHAFAYDFRHYLRLAYRVSPLNTGNISPLLDVLALTARKVAA